MCRDVMFFVVVSCRVVSHCYTHKPFVATACRALVDMCMQTILHTKNGKFIILTQTVCQHCCTVASVVLEKRFTVHILKYIQDSQAVDGYTHTFQLKGFRIEKQKQPFQQSEQAGAGNQAGRQAGRQGGRLADRLSRVVAACVREEHSRPLAPLDICLI